MTEEAPERWFNVDKSSSDEFNFSDEKFVSCQLTKVFHYSEKRNAYWNTTSNKWPGDRAFHFSLEVIKKRIEMDRKMGSYFSIYELPCLAIKGIDDCIILINNHPRSSIPFMGFKNIESLDFSNSHIKEIYDWLNSKFSVYGFITQSSNVSALSSPLSVYTSHSSGPGYYLNYSKRNVKFDIEYLLKGYQLFHDFLGH